MKRREFITLIGGAAAWPLAARAQQRERMRRIGVLLSAVEGDPTGLEYVTAFAQGLAELGWTVGRNVRIEYRWGAGDLPVQLAVKVEFVVNLKTAKTLGLTFPLPLIGRADEVIE